MLLKSSKNLKNTKEYEKYYIIHDISNYKWWEKSLTGKVK